MNSQENTKPFRIRIINYINPHQFYYKLYENGNVNEAICCATCKMHAAL